MKKLALIFAVACMFAAPVMAQDKKAGTMKETKDMKKETKKDDVKKADTKKVDTKKDDTKKVDTKEAKPARK
jgi:Ni/Co efflux regulator RcnB